MGEMEKSLDAEIFGNDAEEKQVIKAYRLSGEAKINGIIEYLDTYFDAQEDEKCILFAHHQIVLNAIENHLKTRHKGMSYIRIDG